MGTPDSDAPRSDLDTAPAHRAWDLGQLVARRRRGGERWMEIFEVPSLSLGVYGLAAGARDPQPVHDRDEIYVVRSGRAMLRVGDDDRPVGPGSIVYVRAGVEHRFHGIEEDLEVLVLFAAAPGTRG